MDIEFHFPYLKPYESQMPTIGLYLCNPSSFDNFHQVVGLRHKFKMVMSQAESIHFSSWFIQLSFLTLSHPLHITPLGSCHSAYSGRSCSHSLMWWQKYKSTVQALESGIQLKCHIYLLAVWPRTEYLIILSLNLFTWKITMIIAPTS